MDADVDTPQESRENRTLPSIVNTTSHDFVSVSRRVATPTGKDKCQRAKELTGIDGEFKTGTITDSTPDTDRAPFCLTPTSSHSGVWYKLQGNDQKYQLSTCNSAVNFNTATKLSVYSIPLGNDCRTNALQCVTGHQGGCSSSSQNGSTVRFKAVQGNDYYILVHGVGDAQGNFKLAVDVDPATPVNDVWTSAVEVTNGQLISGTTVRSFSDDQVVVDCFGFTPSNSNGVWYKVKGTGTVFLASLSPKIEDRRRMTMLNYMSIMATSNSSAIIRPVSRQTRASF